MYGKGGSKLATGIYARISEDRRDNAGVTRQLADCRAVCDRHPEWDSPRTEFVDNDISAWKAGTRRPQYEALLERVRRGEVGRIVVYHVDRLYRQPRELEELIDLADAGHVDVVSVVSGDLDLRSSDGRFLARILVGVAAKESDDKSRRILRQKRHQRELGMPSGGVRAFGWVDAMTPNEEEAGLLREAVEALIAGDSLIGVARRWNVAGVPQPQTGKSNWTAAAIRQLINNPRHAGLIGYRPHKHDKNGKRHDPHEIVIVGPAKWLAIVPRERWELMHAVLRSRSASRVPRRRTLFTGFVFCGRCGAVMVRCTLRNARGKNSRAGWRCQAVLPRQGCGNNSIDASGVEDLVVDAVLRIVDTPDFAARWTQVDESSDDLDLTSKLDELEARRNQAADSFAAGRVPLAAFERAIATIEREADEARRRLAAATKRAPLRLYAHREGLLREIWPNLGLDERRAVLGEVIERVVISPVLKRGLPRFDPDRVDVQWKA